MYSLRAARAALELVGLLGTTLGAPLLARAPERLLRPTDHRKKPELGMKTRRKKKKYILNNVIVAEEPSPLAAPTAACPGSRALTP